MKPSPVKVMIYRVKDNQAKIKWICSKALEALQQEKRLLIAVANFPAAQYVDTLLWRMPAESFIPHVVTDQPTAEWIAITMQNQQNVNRAPRLLNLCPHLPAFCEQVEEIYDFYDETHPQKQEFSQQKLRSYQAKGFLIQPESFVGTK